LNTLPKAWIEATQYNAAKIICDNADNRMMIVEDASIKIKVYVLTTGGFENHKKITFTRIERSVCTLISPLDTQCALDAL